MSAAQRFSWRPAKVLAKVCVVLEDSVFQCDAGWSVDLRDLRRAAYVDSTHPWGRVLRFDLQPVRGKPRRLTLTDVRGRGAGNELAYVAMVRATLRGLATVAPDTPVLMEEYGAARWGLFLAALLMLALPLAGAALIAFGSGMWPLMVAGMALSWVSYAVMRWAMAYAPWRQIRGLPASGLEDIF